MLIDARTLPVGEVIKSEICIVGAGPAGITIACELAGCGLPVSVLESGGFEYDENTQSLCECETIGDRFVKLRNRRHRQFGGAANAWNIPIRDDQVGLKCLPLDEIDFRQRSWMPHSGWPFAKAHLEPFYARAQAVCRLGPFAYGAEAWEMPGSPRLALDGRLTTGMIQFGSGAVFTAESRAQIERATDITVYLHANVVDIETDEAATSVTRVRVACLQGNKFWAHAKIFVLAAGGIENARLLLLSNKTQKNGLGNQNDLVGRFFMEHPIFSCGRLIPADPQLFNSLELYDLGLVRDVPVLGKLNFTEQAMDREKLLNIYAMLHPQPHSKAPEPPKLPLSSARYAKAFKTVLRRLSNAIARVEGQGRADARRARKIRSSTPTWYGWSRLPNKEREFASLEVKIATEQSPNPSNRVALGMERDRLGLRKVQLHWRWNEADILNNRCAQTILAEEFASARLGRLEITPLGEKGLPTGGTSDHHMGTTRMHTDPKQGVINENCRVHGISNLFIAGSSVFPTAGCANPTLTIVALAVRLADHVRKSWDQM